MYDLIQFNMKFIKFINWQENNVEKASNLYPTLDTISLNLFTQRRKLIVTELTNQHWFKRGLNYPIGYSDFWLLLFYKQVQAVADPRGGAPLTAFV